MASGNRLLYNVVDCSVKTIQSPQTREMWTDCSYMLLCKLFQLVVTPMRKRGDRIILASNAVLLQDIYLRWFSITWTYADKPTSTGQRGWLLVVSHHSHNFHGLGIHLHDFSGQQAVNAAVVDDDAGEADKGVEERELEVGVDGQRFGEVVSQLLQPSHLARLVGVQLGCKR